MRRILLEFERGGSFTADLLEEQAPETCQAFWDLLPIQQRLGHAKFSGHVIYIFPGINLERMENSRCVGVLPGEILFNPHVTNRPPHPKEVMIVYGPALIRDAFGYAPSNLFARITENVGEIAKIGRRIDEQGREFLKISRLV
jgi:hypothetical protein